MNSTSFFKQNFMGEAIHLCASLYNGGYVSSPIAWQWHIFMDQCERKESARRPGVDERTAAGCTAYSSARFLESFRKGCELEGRTHHQAPLQNWLGGIFSCASLSCGNIANLECSTNINEQDIRYRAFEVARACVVPAQWGQNC